MNSNILPDCQNIAAILIFIAHIFHIFLDHIDTQSPDLPLIRGQRDVRILFRQRVIGFTVVDKRD